MQQRYIRRKRNTSLENYEFLKYSECSICLVKKEK